MKPKTFGQYKLIRETEEKKESGGASDTAALGSKISLGDGNDFVPFEISDDPKSEHYGKNKNLGPIVRAFKQGGNWGWSRDDSTGSDKPVKISGKKLFLTGGAVRDHLLRKKPRNVELATNASPDEVYHLLKQNGFDYVGSNPSEDSRSRVGPNNKARTRQVFWVKKSDKNGRPFVFGVAVNEDEFDLEVFIRTPRGMKGDNPESGTHAEDALSRDFTINGMYLALTNDNGPNKDLHDFFGGVHHLKAKRIAPIGDMSSKFKEDPSRILRYVRMLTSYGDASKVGEDERRIVASSAPILRKLDRKTLMAEFRKGMEKDDVDPRKYLMAFRDLGLLDAMFPGKMIDSELPKELSELGDKQAPLAWILRMNDPSTLDDLGFESKESQKIGFLIRLLGMSDDMGEDELTQLLGGYLGAGMSNRSLRTFGSKVGGVDPTLIDAFVSHAQQPRVKVVSMGDSGEEKVSDDFSDLADPFTGELDPSGVESRRKQIEFSGFHQQLKYMRAS